MLRNQLKTGGKIIETATDVKDDANWQWWKNFI
jgi:hypothetical protein